MQKKDILFLFIYMALAVIGIFTIPFPSSAMLFVVIAIGIILTVWGAATLLQYISKKQHGEKQKISGLLFSILSLCVGILLLVFNKGASMVFFPVVIGIFALVSGVLSTLDFIRLKKASSDTVLSLITMIISYAVGMIILVYIGINQSFQGNILGIYMIIFGVIKAIETSYTGRKLRPVQ